MGRFGVDYSGSGYGPFAMFYEEEDNVTLFSNNAGYFADIHMCIVLNTEELYVIVIVEI
jgi:hypothetical protein